MNIDLARLVRRLGPVAVVVGLLVAIMALSTMSSPSISRVPLPAPKFTGPAANQPTQGQPTPGRLTQSPNPRGSGAASVFVLIVTILVGLVVLALLVALGWFLVRQLPRWDLRLRGVRARSVTVTITEAPGAEQEEVHSAVQAGIDELDDEAADPRRAVIACWLRLERAAAAAGTERQPGDTPGDLVHRMLAAHRISAPLLRLLADLYRQARYGPAEVDEGMRERARDALTRLRTALVEAARTGQPEAGADANAGADADVVASDAAPPTSAERR